MASIYKKQNSPFWFVQFIDADGTRRNKSTDFRADNPGETVKARALRAQLEAKELNRTAGEITGGNWDSWVPQYLERHCESPLTFVTHLIKPVRVQSLENALLLVKAHARARLAV
jgi:hypothetical protein